MGWGMGWGWLFGLLMLAGVVLLVVVVVRAVGGGMSRGDTLDRQRTGRSARDVLDERYARGDLSTEEYQERRRAVEE